MAEDSLVMNRRNELETNEVIDAHSSCVNPVQQPNDVMQGKLVHCRITLNIWTAIVIVAYIIEFST